MEIKAMVTALLTLGRLPPWGRSPPFVSSTPWRSPWLPLACSLLSRMMIPCRLTGCSTWTTWWTFALRRPS
jgi:hypothetical protein